MMKLLGKSWKIIRNRRKSFKNFENLTKFDEIVWLIVKKSSEIARILENPKRILKNPVGFDEVVSLIVKNQQKLQKILQESSRIFKESLKIRQDWVKSICKLSIIIKNRRKSLRILENLWNPSSFSLNDCQFC